MHKLHGKLCIKNLRCTCSEFKALSYYSKYKRASKVLTKASLLKSVYCRSVMENAGGKCYTGQWLPGYVIPVVVLLNVAMQSARGLGIDYSANWSTKLLHLLQYIHTFQGFSRSLRHKTPTVATCSVLWFLEFQAIYPLSIENVTQFSTCDTHNFRSKVSPVIQSSSPVQ